MQLYRYVKYFFFVSWNWGLAYAFFMLYHEIRGERKYRIRTTGQDDLKDMKARGVDISHASMYMPVGYYVLEVIMKEITKYPNNGSFLDIGCGKGRVLAVAATFGFTRILGIDFSKELCRQARATLRNYRPLYPTVRFDVLQREASRYNIPDYVTTIFLYNPFDETVLAKVAAHISQSLCRCPRRIHIIYVTPLHKSVFLQEGFTQIYNLHRSDRFEVVILQSPAASRPIFTEGLPPDSR